MKKMEIILQTGNGGFVVEKAKINSSGRLVLLKSKQNAQEFVEEFFPFKILRNQR